MALAALVAGAPGFALSDDRDGREDRAVVRLGPIGSVVLRVGDEELVVRLLGVGPIDESLRAEADRRLVGPVSVIVRPNQAADDQGVPLVELFRDGQSLNEAILDAGLALLEPTDLVPPRLLERLRRAELVASQGRRGLWADRDELASAPTPTTILTGLVRPTLVDEAFLVPPANSVRFEPREGPLLADRDGPVAVSSWSGPLRWLAWPDPSDADAWITWVLERAVLAVLGIWISSQKRRRPIEGMLLGGGFGVLGVLVESCLPSPPAVAVVGLTTRVGSRSRTRHGLPARSARSALPSRSIGASRPPSPLAEFIAATSSGSLTPMTRQSDSGGEAVATSDRGLDSVDLVVSAGADDWEDEPPTAIPPASPFWSEWDYSECHDGPAEGLSTLSHQSSDTHRISISRDEFESPTIPGGD